MHTRGTPARTRAPRQAAVLLALAALAGPLDAAWVIISEIHYAPPRGEPLEFIEIWTGDPPRVDLSDWTIDGDVSFRFPRGTILLPDRCLVVARDPAALAARYAGLRGGDGRLLGPFRGAPGRARGRIALRDAAGALQCEVRYRDRGKWPAAAGGTGRTLVLTDPVLDPSEPESWRHSREAGGTPGEAPELRAPEREKGIPIVRQGEVWRFFRGRVEPPAAWREPGFDDSGWESGPSGFGFSDGDDATEIEDMAGSYLTLYTRRSFTVEDPSKLERLVLLADYDDGFIASLNGREVARANVPPGEVSHDTPAPTTHESGTPSEIPIGRAADLLVSGRNVLAVVAHNASLSSSDLTLIVELESRAPRERAERRKAPGIVINEVLAGEDGYVEVFNPAPSAARLDGWTLTDDPADLTKRALPAGLEVGPRGFLALGRTELGEAIRLRGPELFLALRGPDGRIADALRLDGPGPESPEGPLLPRGRLPDGSSEIETLDPPTPGARNRIEIAGAPVINEILYHPLSDDPGEEFIELSNPGREAVSLEGWSLRGGVRHDFRAGETLAAGGRLVVARDPARLAALHGLDAGGIAGPFEGGLANSGDSIRLVDPRGVTARRLRYSDRAPWPRRADGQGSSLELIHPDLDPSLAASWAASDERPRAEWRTVRYEKECRPAAGRCLPELQLLLLDEGECLIDDIEVKDARGRTIFREDFESGAESWVAQGTHEGSGAVDDPRGGGRSYRLLAAGRGGMRQNYAFAPCAVPANGRRHEVSFRVLWQGGSPFLLTRFGGGGLAEMHRLEVPARPGTPGAPNTALDRAPPPAVGTPVQHPVAPAADEPVDVSVRISSVLPLAKASVFWREEGETSWRESSLSDGGADPDRFAGEWTGRIPPVASGTVEFFIRAEDSGGRTGAFPVDAPRRTALYAVGLPTARPFPGHALLVSRREWNALQAGPRMSNRLRDTTFVQGDSRIFYNVGFQARGSPYTRHLQNNWKVVFGPESVDSRRTWILDRQGGGGKPAERLSYWLMDLLRAPAVRQRYAFLTIPGAEDGICEDVERVDSTFLERYFGSDAAGSGQEGARLYEVDDYIEMSGSSRMQARIPAALALRSLDPEDYRWNFVPTGSAHPQDLEPIIDLARTFDPARTADGDFLRSFDAVADSDQWIRVLAARTLMGDWDTLGRHAGKNAFLFLHPDGRWRLLPWDCDQATQRHGAQDPIYSRGQPQFVRFLGLPPYQRLYLGYLAYLAGRKLEPAHLGEVLGDFRARVRLQVAGIESFLAARREYVLRWIPPIPFQVEDAERIPAADGRPETLLIRGTGPVTVQRIRLLGLETEAKAISLEEWAAVFPAPPPGDALLEALDFGGDVIERATIRIP